LKPLTESIGISNLFQNQHPLPTYESEVLTPIHSVQVQGKSILLKSLRNEKCYRDNPRKDEAHPNEIVHYVMFNHSLVLRVTNYVRKNPFVKNADLPQEDPSTWGCIAEIPRVGGSIPPPGTNPLTLLQSLTTSPLFVTVNDDRASTKGFVEL
jgi:hypothetical protein